MSKPQQIELNDLTKPLHLPNHQNGLPNHHEHNDEELLAHPNDHINRPSTKGAYRPIRRGTIRGSIFAMLASALGTGCLNLPIRVSQLGILPFIFIIMITALLSYFGMYMMQRIILKYKVASYSEMVKKAYGQKIMRYAEGVLIFYPFGFSICLQVIFAKFAVQILSDVIGLPLYEDRQRQIYNILGNVVRIIVSIANIGLNLKHFFQSDLTQMLHTLGKFSVSGCVICMSFIVITAFTGFTKEVHGQTVQYHSILTMDYSLVTFMPVFDRHYLAVIFQGIAGVFFTFLNHQFIFPLVSNLKRPTKKRVQQIFIYSHLEQIAIYLLIGLLGYILLSQHIDSIPISSLVVTSIPTLPLLVGKLMIAISLFFNLPLQIFTARQFLYESLDLQRNEVNLRKINLVLIGSTFVIALFFQGVSMYFGLIGGTVGVMMAGGFPLACFYKLISLNTMDKAVMGYVVLMCVICFAGAMQSVFNPA